MSDINVLKQELNLEVDQVADATNLQIVKSKWLGKSGIIKGLFSQMGLLSAEDKPKFAASANELKNLAEELFKQKEESFEQLKIQENLKADFVDLSFLREERGIGSWHPIRLTEKRITDVFKSFGFSIAQGPEIETEYFCFDALNIPKHHPARDAQDTFYTESGFVLRTHTTSVQARELAKGKLPLKVISCGRVYRNEKEDASHQAMFHQYEAVWIEEGISLPHLQGLLIHVLKALYGKKRKVRFVPKFYPYTEPSIGAQIDCSICVGKGCSSCGGAGWVTILGAGVVHSKVLEEFGFDSNKISGFAFGMGTSRLAAQFYNAANLKALYDNDLRYLKSL